MAVSKYFLLFFSLQILFFFDSNSDNLQDNLGTIKLTPINIRRGPGMEYPVLFRIYKPKIVKILHKVDNWCMIKIYNNDFDGWVRCRALKQGKNKKTIVEVDDILYRMPNFTEPITPIKNNLTVRVLSCLKNVCRVEIGSTKNRVYGWCKKSILWGFNE